MDAVYTIFFYVFAFMSVYIQIFYLVTFLEKRRQIVYHPDHFDLFKYPTVTIAVPCYNEHRTVEKTVDSLLALDYPKNKIKILLIDDGSRDNTWEIIQKLDNGDNVRAFHKENGGKHTALNFALEKCETEFFGCLDADSFVHPQALKRIMKYFENDPKAMAISPSIVVNNPKNILQSAQKVEYDMSVFTKKMLGFVGGIHVTPGPFSIFRKRVFDELGPYHKAHNTEDQEIALRMQENKYKIDHCSDAFVYTNTPSSIKKLYKQRLRWQYGFIRNLFDYKKLLFKKKHGAVAMFTLPAGIIPVFGIVFLFFNVLYNLTKFLYNKIVQIGVVGVSNSFVPHYHFDLFFMNTKATLFLSLILYLLVILTIIIGTRMSEGKTKISISIFYFIIIYSIIGPLWMVRALYNAVMSKESNWTLERRVTAN